MITIKKILTLKPRLQIRKVGELCFKIAKKQEDLDLEYIVGLKAILTTSQILSPLDKVYLSSKMDSLIKKDLLSGEDVYYKCLEILGEEIADWDFVTQEGLLDASQRTLFPHYLFLDRIRSPFNLGAIFRSAESFGIKHIYIREGCSSLTSPRAIRTARGSIETVSYSVVKLEEFAPPCKMFALELGGVNLSAFKFPKVGMAVIGSEETGVSPELLTLCDNQLGRVSIEQFGAKGSINVSVASGILMHSWAIS